MDLKASFDAFCERGGFPGDREFIFKEVQRLYGIPPRGYHSFEGHIGFCIGLLDPVLDLAEDPVGLYWSLLTHDIFYRAQDPLSEAKSARIGVRLGRALGIPLPSLEHSAAITLNSKGHKDRSAIDLQLQRDIDLAIFGVSPEEFDQYEAKVWHLEYKGVYEERAFREARADLLERDYLTAVIYDVPYFRERFEDMAHSNLERSIDRLRNHSIPLPALSTLG